MILDTDLLSRLSRTADGPLHRWLATQTQPLGVAAYSFTEIQFGIAQLRTRNPLASGRLSAWVERVLASSEVVPLGATAARLAGEMRAVVHLRPLGGDLMIAATAVTTERPVATLNLRHFRLIARHFPALVVVDPLEPG